MKKCFLLCLVLALLVGCKSVHEERVVKVTHPDGRVEETKSTHIDESFTLGFSDGPSKTLVGGNLLDVGVNGVSTGD